MEKLVIWDWNGTLLNDVDACVECMNIMLRDRKMNLITTEKYKCIFTFPVQKYYESLGFDFKTETFEKLSVEYIDLYIKHSKKSPLQKGALESLHFFNSKKYTQLIVSASEQSMLKQQVKERQIYHYFYSIIGLDNIHAKSKLQNALDFIINSSIEPEKVIVIGDTSHDYEVAKAIGCNCILVNNGHQYLDHLKVNSTLKIIDSLNQILIHVKV